MASSKPPHESADNSADSRGRHRPALLAGCFAALLLTACGGGGGGGDAASVDASTAIDVAAAPDAAAGTTGAAPPVAASLLSGVSRLIVVGDSLADVGTFGFKFTVQDATNPAGFPVLPELVAAAYGLGAACSHYMDDGSGGVVPRGDPNCTNFAVGGARILRADGARDIRNQLSEAAAKIGQ